MASLKPASSKNMNGFNQLLSPSKYAFKVQKSNSDNNDTDFLGGIYNNRHLETDQAWTYCPQLLHFHEHVILFIILKYDHISAIIYYLH